MDTNLAEHASTTALTVGKGMVAGGAIASVGFGFTELELKAIGVFSGIIIGLIGLIITFYFQQKTYKLNEQKALQTGEWDGTERRVNGTR